MPISLLTNVTSLSAQRYLNKTQAGMASNIGKLSSGLRINVAGDDAAGLGISEKLKSEIRSSNQASRNANDGISLTQVAEGALNEITNILNRMRELSIQSANGVLGPQERGFIQTEFANLQSEINRISEVTEFNGRKLLNGSAGNTNLDAAGNNVGADNRVVLQIGIRATLNDTLTINISAVNLNTLQIATLSTSLQTTAQAALQPIDNAIAQISTRRANLGAIQNRLQATLSNLATSVENMSAANSRIRDVDVAEETASLARHQILSQAGASMLSQANQLPQVALSLLGGR
jgi:flagellin